MSRADRSTRPQIWSRQFTCAALINFFSALNFFMLVPITVLLTVARYDASLGLGGAVAGALLAGAVSARPLAGPIMGRVPPRLLLMVTTAMMIASTALCLLPLGLVAFTLCRFVSGFAFGLGSTATLTVAVGGVPSANRGEATGNFGLSNSLAAAVGPAAGLAVANRFGYDEVVLMVGGCALLGFLAAAALPRGTTDAVDRTLPPLTASGVSSSRGRSRSASSSR
ncbi:MFS transporter [Nocardioides alcanivorans]|uniref:MFS transporter n=1 Tax=Nocardioides alcanivorans TaxID=2897352 RepID=UPI0035E1AF67